jgi:hypothetical protein
LGANADAVISLLQLDTLCEEDVKVARDTTIPPQSRCRVDGRTRFDSSGTRQNLIFTPYPSDTELEMLESVVQLKSGKRNVHVVVTNPTKFPVSEERLCVGFSGKVSAVVPLGSGEVTEMKTVST